MNGEFLNRLIEADGAFVRVFDYLASPDEFDRVLAEFAAFGFGIEVRGEGDRIEAAIRAPAFRLCPDQIEWRLETRTIGRRIAVWNRVTSTNDVAFRASSSQANDGFVALAEEQTAGRGRRGGVWSAERGSSILMSVLLFPKPPLDDPFWLTALAAVAVSRGVDEAIGEPGVARIKWPNDIRVNERKIAGILVERRDATVLGIGLNVNQSAESWPADLAEKATSLRAISGRFGDRSRIVRALIATLDDYYHRVSEQGLELLAREWFDRCEFRDRSVRVIARNGEVIARAIGLESESRSLLVEDEGREMRIPVHAIEKLTNF